MCVSVFGLLRFLVPDFHVLLCIGFGCVCICVFIFYFFLLFAIRFTWTQGGIHFVYLRIYRYVFYMKNEFFSFKMKGKQLFLSFTSPLFGFYVFRWKEIWILSIWKTRTEMYYFWADAESFRRQIKYIKMIDLRGHLLRIWFSCFSDEKFMKPQIWNER